MKLKIDGIAFFYIGFILVLALLLVGLYNYLGVMGIALGAVCMALGIFMYKLEYYIDIDTDEDENDEDEKDIK